MHRRTSRQQAWDQFGLPHVGRGAITHYNKHIRPLRPRCGAKTKSTEDGAPCENLALPSGKCRVHGGATPKGENWHVRQWPKGNAPDAERKLAAKLKRAERDKRRQDKRRAGMTAEERERHERWQRDHKPGPAAERARRRNDRKAAAEIREFLERAEERPISPELAKLQAERERLEAERDALLKSIEHEQAIGVFG